jgi:8-oxo-dGTP diphosphatase
LTVVGAAVTHDDSILACRRNHDRSAGGLWEFPGGKVEPDESPEEALVREVREELAVNVSVGALIDQATTDVEGRLVDLSVYSAHLLEAPPDSSTDHDELRWCTPDELRSLTWSPADIPLVEAVIRSLSVD